MAITVFNGSNSYDSYASLAAADTFCGVRKISAWAAAASADREAALVRATDYVDASYSFPDGVLTDDGLNPLVIKAVLTLAPLALTDTLTGKAERDVVETENELSGVAKKKVKFSDAAVVDPYPAITKILSPITASKASVTVGSFVR